ncbi:MAG: EAL domain-containing protein [gamma proteobacterium symbiont of Taylorina sp.]|nr:EAL domain-containing protein [gamma proteobacterium symbiont of Taylorina sp.]
MTKILIVDDKEENLYSLNALLEEINTNGYHFEIISSSNGAQALEIVADIDDISLVILDIQMPEMNGFEVARFLKSTRRSRHIPIVFLTAAFKADEFIRNGFELGAIDYFTKPIEKFQFLTKIQMYLKTAVDKKQLLKLSQELQYLNNNLQQEVSLKTQNLQNLNRDLIEKNNKLLLADKIIENTNEGIMITDLKGIILSINKMFSKITGYSKQEATGQKANILHSGKHVSEFYQSMWQEIMSNNCWEGAIWNRRKNGEIYQEWLSICSVKDELDTTLFYVGKFSDLSSTKEAQSQLHYMAHYDLLTELPNRRFFNEQIEQSIAATQRSGKKFVIFFMDLDGFKAVNDSLGHKTGDNLLQQFALRLNKIVRKNDTASRFGGDEFTVIANNITSLDQVITIAEKILHAFRQPIIIEKHTIFIGTSIGISVYPDDSEEAIDLIKHADTAMYQAKEAGKDQYCFYTDEMGEKAKQRIQLEYELRIAIEKDQLVLYYQPQYNLATDEIIGLEALVRWQHPQRGLLSPGYFIPAAEQSNLIVALGDWVLNTACHQAGNWFNNGKKPVQIAVNVSPKQFQQKDLIESIKQILRQNNMSGGWLELEITEESLVTNISQVVETLNKLKKLDISLAIDDFGTGYSSLTYLKQFPIDVLKIDQKFVREISSDPSDEAIVKAVIALAEGLEMTALAEGVETSNQKEILAKLNCPCVQGYLYNKPMPAEEVFLLLDEQ